MHQRSYLVFQSESQQVPFTFLYPAGWQAREIVGEDGVEVFIAGPCNQENTYTVSFSVRFSSAPETPEAAMATFLERYRQAPDFCEIGRASGMVASHPAIEVEITYTMPLPLNSLNLQLKIIRERRICFKNDNSLIELIYTAPDEMFNTWLPDFRTLVQTFTLPVEPIDAVFYPLISVPGEASITAR
ncbi:DUF1795 domain-containing protein [Candidatus Poribacteria bacterium]|nr:DUF1795 domain-containing protein [Candidatus Poribacteria bacterium]